MSTIEPNTRTHSSGTDLSDSHSIAIHEAVASYGPGMTTQQDRGVRIALGVICVAVVLWCSALYGGVHLSRWMSPDGVRPLPAHHLRLGADPAGSVLPLDVSTLGRDVFMQTCAVCHGARGFGMPGLGKSLVHSDTVADSTDTALLSFIVAGREATDPSNTSNVAMPPRGGNPKLTDADLAAVVTYVRGLQDPRRLPPLPAYVAKAPVLSDEEAAKAVAAAGGDAELAEILKSGIKLFNATCIACHGPEGVGVQGNGKALQKNDFVKSLKDDDLLAFIKSGRAPSDPKNTTGIQMPPKGGNPALSDDDILDIIEYLRTLQGDKNGAATK